jgi:protein import protein ZIM17
LLREKGELIKRGTLGEEGDLEFWEDGTTTVREPWVEREKVTTRNGDGAGQEELPPGATFKSVRPGDKKAGGDGE